MSFAHAGVCAWRCSSDLDPCLRCPGRPGMAGALTAHSHSLPAAAHTDARHPGPRRGYHAATRRAAPRCSASAQIGQPEWSQPLIRRPGWARSRRAVLQTWTCATLLSVARPGNAVNGHAVPAAGPAPRQPAIYQQRPLTGVQGVQHQPPPPPTRITAPGRVVASEFLGPLESDRLDALVPSVIQLEHRHIPTTPPCL